MLFFPGAAAELSPEGVPTVALLRSALLAVCGLAGIVALRKEALSRVVGDADPEGVGVVFGLSLVMGLAAGTFLPLPVDASGGFGLVLALLLVRALGEWVFFDAYIARSLLCELKASVAAVLISGLVFGASMYTYAWQLNPETMSHLTLPLCGAHRPAGGVRRVHRAPRFRRSCFAWWCTLSARCSPCSDGRARVGLRRSAAGARRGSVRAQPRLGRRPRGPRSRAHRHACGRRTGSRRRRAMSSKASSSVPRSTSQRRARGCGRVDEPGVVAEVVQRGGRRRVPAFPSAALTAPTLSSRSGTSAFTTMTSLRRSGRRGRSRCHAGRLAAAQSRAPRSRSSPARSSPRLGSSGGPRARSEAHPRCRRRPC